MLFGQQGLLRQWRRCWCVISGGTLQVYKLGKAVSVGAARGGREASDGCSTLRRRISAPTGHCVSSGARSPPLASSRAVAGRGRRQLLSRQQLVVEVPLTLCNVAGAHCVPLLP